MTTDDQQQQQQVQDEGMDQPTLYYWTYSLYSIIVRFALELGHTLNPDSSPHIRLRLVNLKKDEHIGEEYLEVNPMGQVPALRLSENRDGNEPTRLLADSSEILAWLCRLQPELIPKDHQEDIQSLLSSFYAFHAKPLTVKPEERNNGITNKAAAMLERTDISESHRRRLEVKSVYHDTKFRTTLDADNIETVESQARDFIRSVSDLLRRRQRQQQQQGDEDFSGSAIYIFGTRPSVADAVVTALLARLMDVGRDDIVDDETARDYTTKVISSSEWQKVMQGRRTLP